MYFIDHDGKIDKFTPRRILHNIIGHSIYSSTSTSWRRRGLKGVPRSDLDLLVWRVFLSTCVGTIVNGKDFVVTIYTDHRKAVYTWG